MNCYDDGFRTQSPLTASYRILERAVGQFASLATSSQDDEGSVTRATQIMVAADLEDRPVLDGATEGAAGVIRNLEGLAVLAALPVAVITGQRSFIVGSRQLHFMT